ncbi:MAG: DUF2062 domain-containing protein, partial [Pseudomonadota bacterium]
LHGNQRPLHSAISLAMGVFMACTPFYGLQTFLIFLVAVLFRLNFLIAFLGSQISIPLIYSLIVPLQLSFGFWFLDKEFSFEGSFAELAKTHFGAWMLGSIVIGGALAGFLGFVWYRFHSRHLKMKSATWTGKMRGGVWGNRFLILVLKNFGLRSGYFFLNFVVPYFYIFAPKTRKALTQYWRIISPDLSWLKRQREILNHLFCFAQTIMDQAKQAHHKDLIFNMTYKEGNLLKETISNRSKIFLFSHFGGWGLTIQGFRRRLVESKIHVIRYKTQALTLDKMMPKPESQKIQEIEIKPGEPLFPFIHEVLSNQGQLALMGDRPFDSHFELKNFMGKLAPIPTTPFRLAKTYGAQIGLSFSLKESIDSYSLLTKTIDMSDCSLEDGMRVYLDFLEKCIQEKPHQWFNLYSFWSQIPTLPNGEPCLPRKYNFVN